VIKEVRTRSSIAAGSILCLLLALTAVTFAASGERVTSKQLSALIAAVRAETTVREQIDAAQKVAYLVKDSDLGNVDEATLHDLASLLDTSNDGVRFWVAGALGYFGGRAMFSVPKLLEILPEVDCQELRGLNSAPAIRLALERIGATPPPRNCDSRSKSSEGV